MLSEIKKRVLLELFITPATVVPILSGGSILLLSEVLGGYAAFAGFVGLMIGFGAFLSNLCFNLESIQKRAIRQWQEKQTQSREAELNVLYKKLVKTEGDADENALSNLRNLYASFAGDIANGTISDHVPTEMVKSINDLFNVCVAKLARSYEIYVTASSMTGNLKKDLLKQRKTVVAEVESGVSDLATVMNEVRALRFKNESDELRQLQRKLNSQLEIAKNTEEAVSAFMNEEKTVDERLKEYQ